MHNSATWRPMPRLQGKGVVPQGIDGRGPLKGRVRCFGLFFPGVRPPQKAHTEIPVLYYMGWEIDIFQNLILGSITFLEQPGKRITCRK